MHARALSRRVLGSLFVGAALSVCGSWLAVSAAGGARASSRLLATFDAAGAHEWTVPAGVGRITFDAFGASGGNVADGSTLLAGGGPGGEARGQFPVTPGETFEIVVGGRGGDNDGDAGGAAGSNGGGAGAYNRACCGGAGGGGGSDVRIGGTGNDCAQRPLCREVDRLIAAGGGGGGSFTTTYGEPPAGRDGGAGGGSEGQGLPGLPANQESGGASWFCYSPETDGSFGLGGSADSCRGHGGVAGGGGGWFGGAADIPAGGGSGYVSGLARRGWFPGGSHRGDGLVTIRTP